MRDWVSDGGRWGEDGGGWKGGEEREEHGEGGRRRSKGSELTVGEWGAYGRWLGGL